MLLRIVRAVCVVMLVARSSALTADDLKQEAKPAASAAAPENAAAWIEQELRRPTDVQYLDTQLGDVVNDLEIRHNINIEPDWVALAAGEKGSELLINKFMFDVPLEGALDHLLEEHNLTWYVDGDVLMITTMKGAKEVSQTKIYSVAGTVDGKGDPDFAAIERVVGSSVFSGAPGPVKRTVRHHRRTKTLVVATNPIEQRAIARLIGELHEAVRYRGDEPVLPPTAESEARINEGLKKPGNFQYLDETLEDFRKDVEKRYGLFIEFDEEAIKDIGAPNYRGTEVLVNFQARNVSLETALDRILPPLGMAWTRDEVSIIVTSKEREPQYRVRRIYRVGDLAETEQDYDDLASLIRDTVANDSWRRVQPTVAKNSDEPGSFRSGTGEIAPFLPAKAIVVTHSARTQQEIGRFLDKLRGANEVK
jgi:hypothetical protein